MTDLEFTSEMGVTPLACYGTDLDIVNAARVSLNNEHIEFTEPGDSNLIRSLIRDEHGAPFEVVNFKFQIEVPIFIARQWFKHRFSSFSEVSGRYSELVPKFYIPADGDVRRQLGKRMSYEYETHPEDQMRDDFRTLLINKSIYDWGAYNRQLEHGIAREQARMFLGPNIYTKFIWTIDLRNLTNFLVLRNDKHAQSEIMVAARKVEEFYKEALPITYALWVNEGRKRLAGID